MESPSIGPFPQSLTVGQKHYRLAVSKTGRMHKEDSCQQTTSFTKIDLPETMKTTEDDGGALRS